MQIKSLKHVEFSDVIECFNESFADYFVKMPTTIDYWESRWRAARVDYSFSYGMFDEYKIVGFIVNGIDFYENKFTAFNSGTGVLPKYRGRKIVKQLYDFAIPELLKRGVEKCTLEVIKENEKAIKAYRSVGFEITKILKCYSGTLKNSTNNELTLLHKELEEVNWENLPNQAFNSWDNHKNAIKILEKNYKYYEVFEQTKRIGYFIINPKSGYLAQFELFDGDESEVVNWQKLFAGIKIITSNIKINNVDAKQAGKIKAIENVGLDNVIDQYEMEYLIKPNN